MKGDTDFEVKGSANINAKISAKLDISQMHTLTCR